jgi:hypothetical protein
MPNHPAADAALIWVDPSARRDVKVVRCALREALRTVDAFTMAITELCAGVTALADLTSRSHAWKEFK